MDTMTETEEQASANLFDAYMDERFAGIVPDWGGYLARLPSDAARDSFIEAVQGFEFMRSVIQDSGPG